MRTWTYRRLLFALEWLDLQWDRPSLTDYYLAQVATDVTRPHLKSPGSIQISDKILKFRRAPVEDSPETIARRNEMVKAKWLMAVGFEKGN